MDTTFNDYSINWKDHPDKGRILAAAVALTKTWKATSAIWATQFPDDAQGIGTDAKLIRRLQAQYGESKKGTSYWRDIPLSPEVYLASGNRTGETVMRAARTLNIQLLGALADTNGTGPDTGTSQMPPPSPPASPRSGPRCEAPRTPLPRAKQSATPRSRPPFSGTLSDIHVPILPSSLRKGKGMDKSVMIETAREDQAPYVPVSKWDAHPDLESVMFQFYLPDGYAKNAPFGTGFEAGLFELLYGPQPPAPEHTHPLLFAFFQNHINRNEKDSPFISMASRLFWTLRQATKLFLKKLPKRSGHALIDYSPLRICLLDTATIPKSTSIFYAKPYHDQLRSRKVFTNGAWMYGTLHEHVAWNRIPPEAAICDFSVAELQELCASDDRLNSLLRLDTISEPGGTGKTHDALEQQALNVESVAAISRLLVFLFAHRPPDVKPIATERIKEYIKFLITGLVEGWKLRPRDHMSTQEWTALAEQFVHGIDEAVGPLQGINRLRFVEAFLQGVKTGFRKWASESTTAMDRLCTRFRLDNVDAILDSALTPPINRFQHFTYEASAALPTPLRTPRSGESSISGPPSSPVTRSAARKHVDDSPAELTMSNLSLTPVTRTATRKPVEDNVRVVIPRLPASAMDELDSSTTTQKRHLIADESTSETPTRKRRMLRSDFITDDSPTPRRRSPRDLPSRLLTDEDEMSDFSSS